MSVYNAPKLVSLSLTLKHMHLRKYGLRYSVIMLYPDFFSGMSFNAYSIISHINAHINACNKGNII